MDEVKNQVMGDTRLNKRLSNILSNLSSDPKNSIPCANKTWAETFAAYRFIENDKVNFDSIMSGHKSATLERIKAQPVVLIPQDTTFLNFATDLEGKEMGTLRRKETNQQLLHTSIAITPSRISNHPHSGWYGESPQRGLVTTLPVASALGGALQPLDF
ncbi:IS4/Tn5 family transposase DNA-binding protein [Microbulbifer sp. JTAC008]|uniref:IS4/Tn5 family transposase DNA-binding protein n=1 Tax=unclassified Microbulbifer TaxID=2619833 RepID=UPI0040394787